MKRAFYLLFAAAAVLVAAVSCEQEKSEPVVIPDGGSGLVVFHAVADQGTRTMISGTSVLWCPDDYISLFLPDDYNNYELTTNITEPSATADFSVQLESYEPDFIAIYPYSAENWRDGDEAYLNVLQGQQAVADTFDPQAYPAVARSTTFDLRFYNVCGGFKVRFTQKGITGLRISANNGESLSGMVRVCFDEDGHPEVESWGGEPYVYLQCDPDEGSFRTDCDYYVSVIPGVLEDGITFTLYTGGEVYWGETYFGGQREIKRGVFACPQGFDVETDFTNFNYETVDLGLSVLWATCNLGATTPEELGYRLAWGEIRPKGKYTWDTYKFGTSTALTKYCTDSIYGTVDGKTSLDWEDDAAVAMMQAVRMPTSEEIQELIDGCSWRCRTINGVRCLVGTSKYGEHNTITFPMDGNNMALWTTDLLSKIPSKAYNFDCSYSSSIPSPSLRTIDRCKGLFIRPVREKEYEVYVDFDLPSGLLWAKCNLGEEGFYGEPYDYGDYFAWAETEPYYESISGNGNVTWKQGKEAGYDWASYKWICPYYSNYERGITKYTLEDDRKNTYWYGSWVYRKALEDGFEGTNEEFISNMTFFPKEDRERFMQANGFYGTWEEFMSEVQNTVFLGDNGDGVEHWELKDYDYEDDAARQILGSGWRIPTTADWEELVNKTNWEWTDDYEGHGVAGFIVSSKKNAKKSIFLPAAGGCSGTGIYSCFVYWSASLSEYDYDTMHADVMDAYYIEDEGMRIPQIFVTDRCNGYPIRPVTDTP